MEGLSFEMLGLAQVWEGSRMETSECLQLPKIAGFLETSEADLTRSIALGVPPLNA